MTERLVVEVRVTVSNAVHRLIEDSLTPAFDRTWR